MTHVINFPINFPGYRIVRELGRGAMATVYLAIQEKFEREVALKVMSPLLDRDPSFAIRFQREARIVAQMSHSSIVHVIDVDQHDGYHYLVMEYLPGGDLKARIVAGERGLGLALKVCTAIASALDSAHARKVVHRDIKPANILFREDATPVLTDFGIARPMDSNAQLTMVGTLIGTLDYMSPEQANGTDLDGRSDLYSLGAVFYEVLTGSVPYPAAAPISLIRQQANDPPPTLPAEFQMLQPFVDQLMAKERNDRYATGAEVIRALRMAIEMANAQRAHVTPRPISPANIGTEYAPTLLAVMGSEATATVQFPAIATRSSAVMPVPAEVLAVRVAAGSTGVIDPAVLSDAEPGEVAAQTLISLRSPAATCPPAAPPPASSLPDAPRASASPAQGPTVASVASQLRRAPVWIAIAVGICVTVAGVHSLVAKRDAAAELAVAAVHDVGTPVGRSSPPSLLGPGAPPDSANMPVPDIVADVESKQSTAESTKLEANADPQQGRRFGDADVKAQREPAKKPKQKTRDAVPEADVRELADQQAQSRLDAERRNEAEIAALLIEAKRASAQGHLWQPAGNSAADRYLAMARIDATNAQAREGLASVLDTVIQEARSAAATGDRAATDALIQRLRVLQPDHAELPALQALLDSLATKKSSFGIGMRNNVRAAALIKSANAKLNRTPLTYELLDEAWSKFKEAQEASPLAPGLALLRARFPESLAVAAKLEFDKGNARQLRQLSELAEANGWQYSDPTRAGSTAADQ